ncbi:hypothetical protein A3862_24860 [Methylobacterium sp. XJLW]|uniref:Protein of unassigned function n=1 Tax=Methylobacterium oryzae CBMB20 TaxID=693986 RepID=A0A089NTF8_9HYPH|nr:MULTISPECIES: hypothetical protein [Methylobacterium]AIQ89128.1 protein of unassigned function [Methylobacterium oryzae CBMB20]AWV18349.1 hypothetical protein A3862_24860 [Methylobacterium sp. XJLW]
MTAICRQAFGLATLLLAGLNGAAAQSPEPAGSAEAAAALNGGAHLTAGAQPASVETCWADWKAKEKLEDGKNEKKNGYFVYVAHEQAAVAEPPGSRNWLVGRNAAFTYAEISARKSLAESMRSTMRSSRSAAVQMFGGSDAPPSLRPVVEQLSIVDKSRVLADKALDAEIKKFDPQWSGGTAAQQRAAIATQQLRIDQSIESRAEMFASGAFTVVQCEGPSVEDAGKYHVLTGLIWSPKLAGIAETIWNTTLTLQREAPQPPIRQQFEAIKAGNPDWLAYTMGARVFTDENGERVVVGFGVAPQTNLMPADRSRASLAAMAAIQQFVSERVVANRIGKDAYESRGMSDGSVQSFNLGTYNEAVRAQAADLQLKGAAEILSWRGEHPWSKAKMQVVAVAWSQRWAKDADAVGRAMGAAEQRMTKQGGLPRASATADEGDGGAPAAAPVRAGAAATTSDF